jgi:hypothetical protein
MEQERGDHTLRPQHLKVSHLLTGIRMSTVLFAFFKMRCALVGLSWVPQMLDRPLSLLQRRRRKTSQNWAKVLLLVLKTRRDEMTHLNVRGKFQIRKKEEEMFSLFLYSTNNFRNKKK